MQPSALPARLSASWLPATLSASWLRAGVSASWLRASCPCPACLDPGPLGVQGGPMRGAELAAFAASPYADAACRLRRWDDAAKDPDVTTLPFDHFGPLLTQLLRSAG